MFKRLLSAFLVGVAIFPAAVSAVTVTTDLQGELIKGSQPAVYFYGEDGKRYVFPNEKIFYTWFSDFSSVREITDEQLAAISIGGNVTYRPGTKLVKVTTDPRVYAVSGKGMLRWVTSEQLAKALYGSNWSKQVQDIPDALFQDYSVGESIRNVEGYQPDVEKDAYKTVSNVIAEPESVPTVTTSTHTIVLTSVGGVKFTWTDTAVSSLGYKLVWSKNANPTYPTRDGDEYAYYSGSDMKSGMISDLEAGSQYFVRVCQYLGGSCGAYSNQVTITAPMTESDSVSNTSPDSASSATSSHVIVLTSTRGKNFSWTDTAVSSLGYKLVWSKNANPTYPTRDGDTYAYYSDPNTKSGSLSDVDSGASYYVRVCEYLGGSCGAYSNQVTVIAPASVE